MKRRAKLQKRKARKAQRLVKASKDQRRAQAKADAIPACDQCGAKKTQRPKHFFDPFRGWWRCEPCQARHYEEALAHHAALGRARAALPAVDK